MTAKNAKQVKKEVKLANRQTRVVRGTKYGSLWGGFYAGYRKGVSPAKKFSKETFSKEEKRVNSLSFDEMYKRKPLFEIGKAPLCA